MYERIKTIAIEAGKQLIEGFGKRKELRFKGAVDLVTQYDLQIELFLKTKLADAFPGYSLIGEETSQSVSYPDKAIYIDPIDGTTNFVHGIPFCAISIGIWEGGVPVAGVVYNPLLNELFYAQKGKGVTMNDVPISVSSTDTLKSSLIATGFPHTKTEEGEDFEWVIRTMAAILPKTRDIRRLGSAAIDLCYVARGTFEGYYEINLRPWDVAAGVLILQEAGGRVSSVEGGEYGLDQRIIIASNGSIHDTMVEKIEGLKGV